MKNKNYLMDIAKKYAEQVDTRIYRIFSGKFKLRRDGELVMRFNENKKIKAEELKNE